jgi:formylglycine-generating enzyme required for sulfatase activity
MAHDQKQFRIRWVPTPMKCWAALAFAMGLWYAGEGFAASAGGPVIGSRAAGQSFRACSYCPEMILLPPGRFTIGSPMTEAGRGTTKIHKNS